MSAEGLAAPHETAQTPMCGCSPRRCNNSAYTSCPTLVAQQNAAALGAKYAPKQQLARKPTRKPPTKKKPTKKKPTKKKPTKKRPTKKRPTKKKPTKKAAKSVVKKAG